MKTHNANNERIKRKYYAYLKEAKGQSEQSIDSVVQALLRYETYTKRRDFKTFHREQVIGFKRQLYSQRSQRTGAPLSKATTTGTLAHLKRFFHWLAREPGYKSRIHYSDAEYFSASDRDARIASAHRDSPAPTVEQVVHTLSLMPNETEIQLRDRALVAFTLLTGARDGAIATVKMKHVDLIDGCLVQDAREINTKFAKTFTTWFFPVGEFVREIVEDWIKYLRVHKLWGTDDPMFPATLIQLNSCGHFATSGLDRKHWSNAGPIRKVFKSAFENAGVPYFNPHSFRHTLARLGQQLCRTPEQYKAWSQNLGHEGVLTTLTSYGPVGSQRQAEIIKGLSKPTEAAQSAAEEIAEVLLRRMRAEGLESGGSS